MQKHNPERKWSAAGRDMAYKEKEEDLWLYHSFSECATNFVQEHSWNDFKVFSEF